MNNSISYEFNNFYNIVTNHYYFKNRFIIFKLIKEEINKICAIIYCNKLQKLCFIKVKSICNINNFNLNVYNTLKNNNHVNIECVLDIHIEDNIVFILSEYIEGKNLSQLENPDKELLRKIINQTYEGLNFIHKLNIIHGDIKLENIMLTEENIKIIDFDLSKICNNYISSKTLFGSENYISPESFDLNIYSKKSDIWSFGISLYKLIAGKFPYIFKPNKFHHMYFRNNFKMLDFKELDKLSDIYDYDLINYIKKMLNFVDDNRPLSVKI